MRKSGLSLEPAEDVLEHFNDFVTADGMLFEFETQMVRIVGLWTVIENKRLRGLCLAFDFF